MDAHLQRLRYSCTALGVPTSEFDAVCRDLGEVKRGPVGVTYVFRQPKEIHTGKPAAVQAILARSQAMQRSVDLAAPAMDLATPAPFEFPRPIHAAASPDLSFGQQWDGQRMTATLRDIKHQWER